MNIKKLIVESIQSENDLKEFVRIIINRLATKAQSEYANSLRDYEKYFSSEPKEILLFVHPVTITYDELKYTKQFSKEFKNILKESVYLTVYLTDGEHIKKEGSYINKQIFLYIKKNKEHERIIETNTNFLWVDFFDSFRSTLIHEVQHWYDDIRSEGKYTNDKASISYYDKKNSKSFANDKEQYDAYLRLNHEVSARFSQFIQRMYYTRIRSMEDAIYYLKTDFIGWNLLDSNTKKALIRRTAIFYSNYYDKKKPVDITEKINTYRAKKEAEGYSLGVYVKPKYIELDYVEGGDVVPILKDLSKFCDIYRRTLVIRDFILKNVNKEDLKQLNIVPNKGKNKDFYLNWDVYYRKSKRPL